MSVFDYIMKALEKGIGLFFLIHKYYPFVIIILSIPLLLVHVINRFTLNSSRYSAHGSERPKVKRNYVVQSIPLLVMILNAIIFATYRYLFVDFPQGSDTPQYIYMLKKIDHGAYFSEIAKIVTAPKILFPYLLYFCWKTSHLEIMTFMKVLPVFLMTLISISSFLFVYYATRELSLAFLTGFIIPTWSGSIFLSYGHYANMSGVILSLLSLTLIFAKDAGTILSYCRRYLSLLLAIMLPAVHLYTSVILVLALGMIAFFDFIFRHFNRRYIDKFTFIRVSKFLIANILTTLVIVYLTEYFSPHVFINLIKPALVNPISTVLWLASRDSVILILFAITSVVIAPRFGTDQFLNVLIPLLASPCMMIFLSGFELLWRYWLLYPVPILVAWSLSKSVRFTVTTIKRCLSKKSNIRALKKGSYIRHMISIAVLVLLISSSLPSAYVPGAVYKPPEELLEQLSYIEKEFGFANSSVKVFLNMKKGGYIYRWALAIVGDFVCVGEEFEKEWFSLDPHSRYARYFSAEYFGSIFNLIEKQDDNLTTVLVPNYGIENISPIDKLLLRYYERNNATDVYYYVKNNVTHISAKLNPIDYILRTYSVENLGPQSYWQLTWPKQNLYNISMHLKEGFVEFSYLGPNDKYIIFKPNVSETILGKPLTILVEYSTNSTNAGLVVEYLNGTKIGSPLTSKNKIILMDVTSGWNAVTIVFKPSDEELLHSLLIYNIYFLRQLD